RYLSTHPLTIKGIEFFFCASERHLTRACAWNPVAPELIWMPICLKVLYCLNPAVLLMTRLPVLRSSSLLVTYRTNVSPREPLVPIITTGYTPLPTNTSYVDTSIDAWSPLCVRNARLSFA